MSARAAVLRPLRRPGIWLALWLLAVATVIAGSLLPPPPVPSPHPQSDKLVHVLGYFVLMAAAVQLFAHRFWLWGVGIGLAALGLGLEWAQGALTATRMFDWHDAIANATGVVLGGLLALTPAATWLQRLEPRLFRSL